MPPAKSKKREPIYKKASERIRTVPRKNIESKTEGRIVSQETAYIVAIVVNFVFLYVFNNILTWGVPFLTYEFSEVLPVINFSIIMTIVANILFMLYDRNWIKGPVRFALSIISVYVMYILLLVFPFDFSFVGTAVPIALFARISLVIGIIVTLIGAFAELIKRSVHSRER